MIRGVLRLEVLVDQFCRVLCGVVVLVVEGDLHGTLAKGEVKRCLAYESKACKELHSGFCWVGREIMTQARAVSRCLLDADQVD